MATWEPAWLQEMVAWFKNPRMYMYGRWDNPPSRLEGGVDLTAPTGTPVYALATGKVLSSGYFCHGGPFDLSNPTCPPGSSGIKDYGVVTQRINVPGYGMEDIYYQHIMLAAGIHPGEVVQKGTEIGTVGPFGETEVGFNPQGWGALWGGNNHPGPWYTDPRPLIKALMTAGPPGASTTPLVDTSPSGSSNSSDSATLSNSNTGIPGVNIDFSGLQAWATQAGIVVAGAVIIIVALILVFK